MANGYKVIPGGPYPHFITCSIVRWQPVFLSDAYFRIVTDSLQHLRETRGLAIHAYVIMPTHIHAVLTALKDDLSGIMRDFKRFTSRAISQTAEKDNDRLLMWIFRNAAEHEGQSKVWQDEFHPKALMTRQAFIQKIEYIHNNPVSKGIVECPSHWRYSSAAAYDGVQSVPLEIDVVDW